MGLGRWCHNTSTCGALQVRADCAPEMLSDFLISDTADEADENAISLYNQVDEEAALLEEVSAYACDGRLRFSHWQSVGR